MSEAIHSRLLRLDGNDEPVLLHLTTRKAWESAQETGTYAPGSLDVEGFVHLSAPNQILATAERHFPGVNGLVLLTIAAERLAAPLRYETVPEHDELFPHLYGPLNLDAVTAVVDFTGMPPAARDHRR